VEFGCKLALAWPYKRRLTGVINIIIINITALNL
jgi:hypothetical protein